MPKDSYPEIADDLSNFPPELKNGPLFAVEGLGTAEDRERAESGTWSYDTVIPTFGLATGDAVKQVERIKKRDVGVIVIPLRSALTGTKICFHFYRAKDNRFMKKMILACLWNNMRIIPTMRKDWGRYLFKIHDLTEERQLEEIDLGDLRRFRVKIGAINEAVRQCLNKEAVLDKWHLTVTAPISNVFVRATEIVQGANARVIAHPEVLNRTYKSFRSFTYGETGFKQLELMVEELQLTKEDVFVDLGSGIGNVAMFFSATCTVKKVVGFELNKVPAQLADDVFPEFIRGCRWYGLTPSPIYLEHADLTHRRFLSFISKEATVIFVNNLLFEPVLHKRIRDMIKDIDYHGRNVRIISTKPFADINEKEEADKKEAAEMAKEEAKKKEEEEAEKEKEEKKKAEKKTVSYYRTNFVKRNRTLMNARKVKHQDLDCLLNVTPMKSAEECVSWTGKEVKYYLHTFNGAKGSFARYYEDKKKAEEDISLEGSAARTRPFCSMNGRPSTWKSAPRKRPHDRAN